MDKYIDNYNISFYSTAWKFFPFSSVFPVQKACKTLKKIPDFPFRKFYYSHGLEKMSKLLNLPARSFYHSGLIFVSLSQPEKTNKRIHFPEGKMYRALTGAHRREISVLICAQKFHKLHMRQISKPSVLNHSTADRGRLRLHEHWHKSYLLEQAR